MKALPKNWQKKFYIIATIWMLVAAAAAGILLKPQAAVFAIIGALLLLGGFKITELLIAILTGVRKANHTAVGMLFVAKFSWWALLFLVSKNIPLGMGAAVGMGFGSFLCAVLSLGLMNYGMPKISSEE